eukprot:3300-Heterococcus_DN1.PRE.1
MKAKAEHFTNSRYKFLRVTKDGRDVPVESREKLQTSHVIIELEQDVPYEELDEDTIAGPVQASGEQHSEAQIAVRTQQRLPFMADQLLEWLDSEYRDAGQSQ